MIVCTCFPFTDAVQTSTGGLPAKGSGWDAMFTDLQAGVRDLGWSANVVDHLRHH